MTKRSREMKIAIFILLFILSCASIEKTTYYDFKTTKPKIFKEVVKSDVLVTKNITPDHVSFLIAEELICEEKEDSDGKIFGIDRVGQTGFSALKKELFRTGIISGVIYCGSGI